MIAGVFLYIRGAAYIEETIAALQTFDLNIERIEANSEIVSNLVPNALQRGAESWLILYLPDKQQELLIVPFPGRNHFENLRYPVNFRDYLADLIPILRQWLQYDRPYIPRDFIGRFQYIRHGSSLDSLLTEVFDVPRSRSGVEIQSSLLMASQSIQRQRSEVLSEGLTTTNPVVIDRLLNKLDEVFLTENDEIFQYLQTTPEPIKVVPPIVTDFEDIIDNETGKFLITSETVKKFADGYSPSNFDYSAPGCGLWKAVERELNLSLVLHLRRERGIVVDVSDPWIGSEDSSGIYIPTGQRRNVNLNERESRNSRDLQGITLGPMNYMLKSGNYNGIRRDLQNIFQLDPTMLDYLLGQGSNTLPRNLDRITRLRNGHAHISAMSRDKFEELRNLVLPSQANQDTCLVKILQLKRKVFEL